eukprot:6255532-Amphidinium_carterae.1
MTHTIIACPREWTHFVMFDFADEVMHMMFAMCQCKAAQAAQPSMPPLPERQEAQTLSKQPTAPKETGAWKCRNHSFMRSAAR